MAVKNDWMKVKLNYLINRRWVWYAYMYILWWMWNAWISCVSVFWVYGM